MGMFAANALGLARDLLQVQARRQLAKGFSYAPPDRMFREFEAAFPYEETPDQLEAIEAEAGSPAEGDEDRTEDDTEKNG